MKIYFAASIRGSGGIKPEICRRIVDRLRGHGSVFTEHICEAVIKNNFDEGTDKEIYERDVQWLRSADMLVAEVSIPSLGVGYEIGIAEGLGKEILCLYFTEAPDRLSAMIEGNENISIKKYDDIEEVLEFIDDFFYKLSGNGSVKH